MESKKYFNIYLFRIDHIEHDRGIVAVHTYILHYTIMSIKEYDYESGDTREYELEDLDTT